MDDLCLRKTRPDSRRAGVKNGLLGHSCSARDKVIEAVDWFFGWRPLGLNSVQGKIHIEVKILIDGGDLRDSIGVNCSTSPLPN
ncbi:MAG: hypothetical protein DWH78_05555 [Planctomycetota bacterium]|nr:MAG: hypothetical protein DWH78_05555 [Planctomycetota bacterium]